MPTTILAIDQGTSSTRALLFDAAGTLLSQAQIEIQANYPKPGWVEQDADEILKSTLWTCQQALEQVKLNPSDLLALGITNQRETTILWERDSGKAIHPAIVWQDRRTADYCQALRAEAVEDMVQLKTGLLLDPYFSASKISWILEHVPAARRLAEQGKLAFGTVDSYLIWHLTGGRCHVTDATNASRTLLFNIHTNDWDEELLRLFSIPRSLLPEVKDTAEDFGHTDEAVFGGRVQVAAVAGDQQAALVGQGCVNAGMAKSTYGTGCFLMLNTGDKPVKSENRLLTTVGYRISGKTSYALEGSIFSAGSSVQWLRDQLKVIQSASETEHLSASLVNNEGVYLVPAFTGLGAPYWQPNARAVFSGLRRDTGIPHLARAALEAVCYQTFDLCQAMQADMAAEMHALRVDGGMTGNRWLLQFLADTLGLLIDRPKLTETTALGVALLAGLQCGLYSSLNEMAKVWVLDQAFEPSMPEVQREKNLAGWQQALAGL